MPAPLRRARFGILARGLAMAGLLGATAPWWGPAWCAALAPLLEGVLAATAAPWDTVQVTLAKRDEQAVLAAQFSTARGFVYRGFPVPPGVWVQTQTLQGYAWQHPVILLTLWAAWPFPAAATRLRAGAALLMAIVPLAVLDLSLTLRGSLTDLMLAGTAPELIASSIPVQAMRLLEAGGRAALDLAVGVAMLAVLRRPATVGPAAARRRRDAATGAPQ